MNSTVPASPYIYRGTLTGTTHTDYSHIPGFKQPTLEEQIADMQKEIDELRQEVTVLKTLLPSPAYVYPMTNASE